jgi:hypothetical protein
MIDAMARVLQRLPCSPKAEVELRRITLSTHLGE